MPNKSPRLQLLVFIAVIALVAVLVGGCSQESESIATESEVFTLDNGMQIILKENHASPMATSLIFVRAGSKYENRFNNGVTHFLEHLLFNGTANQTGEELTHGIERLGGYINAFTRKEFTAFLVSMPRDFIDYGIATQADMLFNSVFPEESFTKERKIVIEEIKMGKDTEGAPAEAFFEKYGWQNTPYDQPIIGYKSIIANIPREAIIDYYKRFYAPNNMMALIIGDFDSDQMKKTVENIMGQFPAVELPLPPQHAYQPLQGKNVRKTAAKTRATYVDFSIEAPPFEKPEYFGFNLIGDYLDDQENSPLHDALKSGPDPLATTVSVYLDTKEELTRLNIGIITEKPEAIDSIVLLTDRVLGSLAQNPPSAELLEGYKTSRRCYDIYMSEKLHHYGFTIAPLMAVTGWDFFRQFQDRLDSVKTDDVVAACRRYLSRPAYIASAVYPPLDSQDEVFVASGPLADEVRTFFEQQTFPEYDLAVGGDFELPATGEIETITGKHSSYLREVLDNGLTVIIKSNPYSRVFALNVLGKNRCVSEPAGRDGITDFVNRMIEKGTRSRSADQLARELAAIGANVTLYDNPWIPFDDRYTTHEYSFMKFETIDEFHRRGIELFSDMIKNPAFNPDEVENVRQQMLGIIGRNTGSTYKTARREFYSSLFEGHPYARTIEGSFRSVSSITVEDLKEHHRRFYAPENMIMTIATSHSPGKVIALIKEHFGDMPPGRETPPPLPPESLDAVKTAHASMDKEQVYIYIGGFIPSALSPEAAALEVAGEILSGRLRKNLREKEGLAYTVGASAVLDKNTGWYICSIGTGTQNFERAKTGILNEIEKLKNEPPTEAELEETINSIWGSSLMANLSRIGQAYYMGVYEYLGLGYNYAETYMENIKAVTPEKVSSVVKDYFATDHYVIATAGKI